MSKRFNKQTPSDFGLIETDEGDFAICPNDHSRWMRCSISDLGWGSEIVYYRVPLPCFAELLQIIIESIDFDDIYGAAAIIIEKYPNNLLEYCEELFAPPINVDAAKKLIKVLQLDQCINRSPIQGKSFAEITNEFIRWQEISTRAKSLMKNHSCEKKGAKNIFDI